MKAIYQNAFQSFISVEKQKLPDQTLQYWNLAQRWNGVVHDKKMTVTKAFETIRSIQSELNPQRPLNLGLEILKQDIVEHGSKSQQRKSTPKIATKLVVL